MRWKDEFCKEAKYFMKNDDDVVIHIERLKYWVENIYPKTMVEQNEEKLIFGSIQENKRPIRDPLNKW